MISSRTTANFPARCLFLFSGLFVPLLLISCQKDRPVANKAHLAKPMIWGGERVAQQDALAGTAVAIMKSNGFPFCTGVYLGGQIIATAAHCLTEITSPLAYISFDLQTPTDWNPVYGNRGPNSPNSRKIRSFVTHAEFDPGRFTKANLSKEPSSPLFDLGMLIFEGAAPTGARAAEIVPPTQSIGPETELMLAGYGRSDSSGGDYGRLYKVLTHVGQLRATSLEIVDGPNLEKGSCVGDSGGPVMAKTKASNPGEADSRGSYLLSGLVSYGPSDCGLGKGFNTDLRYFVDWVAEKKACLDLASGTADDSVALKNSCGASAVLMKDLVPTSRGSFYDICVHRSPGTSSFHTMTVLLDQLGTQNCLEAAALSTRVKALDLSHKDLVDIAPLEHFVSLEELDLSYNKISESKPLASLQNLKKLSLLQSGLEKNLFSTLGIEEKFSVYGRTPSGKAIHPWLWLSAISPGLQELNGVGLDEIPFQFAQSAER